MLSFESEKKTHQTVAEVKGKFVQDHGMLAYRGSKGIRPFILNLDASWR